MPALQCTCVLNEQVPVPGRPGFFQYYYECTWNEGDTGRYNVSVTWNDPAQAQVMAEGQCPYDPPPKKDDC